MFLLEDNAIPTHASYLQYNFELSSGAYHYQARATTSSFAHRCSRQIFGDAKDFCRDFSILARKVFLWLLPINFLLQRSWRPSLGITSKKGLHVFFCKRWALCLEIKQHWVPFFPGFSYILHKFPGILLEFSTNHYFWGCACTPCTTASYNSAFA